MYIIDLHSISPQKTHNSLFFEGPVENFKGGRYYVIEPNYGDLIPKRLLRRMGKTVRMGIGAGMPLIERQNKIDGIIVATATGGIDDSINFLNQIIDYEEGTLTPTNFVQSTPNSISGHLAMMSKNTGYNNTHIGMGNAFESALLDGLLLFEENQVSKLLIGSVEENSSYNYNIDSFAGNFKKEDVSSSELLASRTEGSVCGEGAAMFVFSNKKENAICQLIDVHQFVYPDVRNIEDKARQFLEKNNVRIEDIDSLILGFSGDIRSDFWYTDLMQSFSESTIYTYKNLVGEYPTASAFATWLAANVLGGKSIPKEAIYREKNRVAKNILIYNNYLGEQHGFILLGSV